MKIKSALNQLDLHQNAYDPCLFTGFMVDPPNPTDTPSPVPLTLGLYIDNFIYFSEDPAVEGKLQHLLKEQITVDFMGMVEWFLGTHFQWLLTRNTVKVHLSQTRFAAHLVEENNVHLWKMTPNATSYCLGFPIDAMPESDKDNDSPMFQDSKRKYQSIVGSISWLAQSTQLDLAPSHSFLSAYSNKPSCSH
jgi:hypothetical protein